MRFGSEAAFFSCTGGCGAISLTPTVLYTPERGYGFVEETARDAYGALQVPELNSAFYPAKEGLRTALFQNEDGIAVQPEGHPLILRVDVDGPGTYEVVAEVFAPKGCGRWFAFTQNRRCGHIGAGGEGRMELQLPVHVCDIVPGGTTRAARNSIDITLVGDVRLMAVEIRRVEIPVLYLLGDSTVADQQAAYPYRPGVSHSGWGQMLPLYFKGMAVSNHAHNGLTVETFHEEGHWPIVQEMVKEGDWALIQFGHNDQKRPHLQAAEGYSEGLALFVAGLRDKGARPVLVTSLARNTWKGDGNGYNDLLADYAVAVERLAGALDVPLLDLHTISMRAVKEAGLTGAKRWFYPGDHTHGNDYGAYHFAGLVAKLVAESGDERLAELKEALWVPPELNMPREEQAALCKGWCAPPPMRQELPGVAEDPSPLTRRRALELGQGFYGYFAMNDESLVGLPEEIAAAMQNGYWPEWASSKAEWLDAAATAEEAFALLRGAFAGRNEVSGDETAPAWFTGELSVRSAWRLLREWEARYSGVQGEGTLQPVIKGS